MSASASADGLLSHLRAEGMRLELGTNGLINVAPKDRVTDRIRDMVRANKPALLAALASERPIAEDLAQSIRSMAERWGYAPDEIAWALSSARADPDGWSTLCALDVASVDKRVRAGLESAT